MQFKRYSLFALLLAALLFAPQAVAQNGLTVGPPISPGPDHDQSERIGGDVVITHSKFEDVIGGGVACSNANAGYTTQNSYWRLFDFADMGITDAVTLTSVDLGVGRARLNGNDPVSTTLRFYTLDGDFLVENLTVIGEEEVILEDKDNPFLAGVPITSSITVPGGAMFVVAWDTPSGDPEDTGDIKPFDIRYGQNSDGETGPTYLSAPEGCGIAQPTPAGDLGDFGNLHWVLYVNGTTDPVSNEEGAVAQRVTLGQAYPNPVAGQASIPFSLENAQHVRIAIYDALGREVAVAAHGAFGAGEQSVVVSASGLPNGVYFYRISTEGQTLTRKMVVMQ